MEPDISHPLLTDLYELTMVDAARRAGMAERPASFSLFIRTLPPDRGFLVAAGLDDCLTWLEELRFGDAELTALARLGLFDEAFLSWLGDLRFTGNVRAVREGTPVLAGEPILEVDAPFAEAQLAETFLLNQVTLQTVLATKALRCVHAAAGRPVVDFALRRTPGIDAGMKLARVGALVGLAGTSNVAGADRYPIAANGTMAHSFVQAHPDETDAFRVFTDAYGDDAVLLVDTYDTRRGVARAIEVARESRERGGTIRGVRLDSGDLAELARDARRQLDDAGFAEVDIIVSGGLDEYEIDRLLRVEQAPIDGFGVGTSLGTSSDAPTVDSVYKLVEYDGRAVRKTSEAKATWPGRKQLWRHPDWSEDVLALAAEDAPSAEHQPLLDLVMEAGARTAAGRHSLAEAHENLAAAVAAVPAALREMRDPQRLEVTPSAALLALTEEIDERRNHEPLDALR